MNKHLTILAALLILGFSTVGRAESEGNGDPFPFASEGQHTGGNPFVSDSAQTHYPVLTGNTTQSSSLATLVPSYGSETAVHTAQSLPLYAIEGTVAYLQSQSLERAAAAAPVRVASFTRP